MKRIILALLFTALTACGSSGAAGPSTANLLGTWRGITSGSVVSLTLTVESSGTYFGSGSVTTNGVTRDYGHVDASPYGNNDITVSAAPNVNGHGFFLQGTHTATTISGTLSGDVSGAIVFTKQ